MSSRLKIGIIGCRMISASHIRGYLYLPEKVEIVALCDVVPDSAERRLNNFVEEAKIEMTKQTVLVYRSCGKPATGNGFRFSLIISGFWTYLVWM